jgi:ubiquinone/menaquinone biosynthesis C-methylase UbiE
MARSADIGTGGDMGKGGFGDALRARLSQWVSLQTPVDGIAATPWRARSPARATTEHTMTRPSQGPSATTDSSEKYFEEVAGSWDEMRSGFFPTSIRESALDMVAVQAGESAADIGAGTGFLTEALLQRGLKVVAVDRSKSMLAVLCEKLARTGDVECRSGTSEDLPVADGSVDRVFANMYLHHVEDPEVAIREMVRIVRPGGTVVVTDLDRHDHEFLRTEHQDRWMGFERDQVRRWFADVGLVGVRIECAGADCRTTSAEGEEAGISIFQAAGTRPAGSAMAGPASRG